MVKLFRVYLLIENINEFLVKVRFELIGSIQLFFLHRVISIANDSYEEVHQHNQQKNHIDHIEYDPNKNYHCLIEPRTTRYTP